MNEFNSEKIINEINNAIEQKDTERKNELNEIRNLNHKNYFLLDIDSIRDLPNKYKNEADDIINLYNAINSFDLLKDDEISAIEHTNIIGIIKRRINKLKDILKSDILSQIKQNDDLEKELNLDLLNDTSEDNLLERKILTEKLNSLKFFNITTDINNPKIEFARQEKRKKYILDIKSFIDSYKRKKTNKEYENEIISINNRIKYEIKKYLNKIEKIRNLMGDNREYQEEFDRFISYIQDLFVYDETDYEESRKTLETLLFNSEINNEIQRLNSIFSNNLEIEEINQFDISKISESAIQNLIKYIENYYIDLLDNSEKQIIYEYGKNINNKNLGKYINSILYKIWSKSLTNPFEYQIGDKFKFLCTKIDDNNPDYVISTLITDEELMLVMDYTNYKMGYICNCQENIKCIYLDEDFNESINENFIYMTPRQIEEKFIKEKKTYRIALDNQTKFIGLFFIKNGELDSDYENLKCLAQEKNLPLFIIDIEKYKIN